MSYDPENIPEDARHAGRVDGYNEALDDIRSWIRAMALKCGWDTNSDAFAVDEYVKTCYLPVPE